MTISIRVDLSPNPDTVDLPADVELRCSMRTDEAAPEQGRVEYVIDPSSGNCFEVNGKDTFSIRPENMTINPENTPVRRAVRLKRKAGDASDWVEIIVTVTSANGLHDNSPCTVITPV
jgi:hypothetical protein